MTSYLDSKSSKLIYEQYIVGSYKKTQLLEYNDNFKLFPMHK